MPAWKHAEYSLTKYLSARAQSGPHVEATGSEGITLGHDEMKLPQRLQGHGNLGKDFLTQGVCRTERWKGIQS